MNDWSYRQVELMEGETIVGVIERLPKENALGGNSLYLNTGAERISIHATAKRGHTVLERRLDELGVKVGDRISIHYTGKRSTANGEREYRHYTAWLMQ